MSHLDRIELIAAARRWHEDDPDSVGSRLMVMVLDLEANQHRILNTPEVKRFALGAELEAAHQRARWGAAHDAGKSSWDWFWLIGYLAQKAAVAAEAGDVDKAMHHTISTAAALANWHLSLSGTDTAMRPGIDPADYGVPA